MEAGLLTAKGSSEPIASADVASALADEIGYPVIIKAAAGGGGIGMQIVQKADEFESALKLCQSRAKSAFGDERVSSRSTSKEHNTWSSSPRRRQERHPLW